VPENGPLRPDGLPVGNFLPRGTGRSPSRWAFLRASLRAPRRASSCSRTERFGRLLVEPSTLHLAKHAFALHLLLEHPKRLVDVVVANHDLQEIFPSCG
jgi:hypothetical protein